MAADKDAYVLNGALFIVMNFFAGIKNWMGGMILVDRSNKESRKASKEKMIYALRHGASIIIFPEGTWNLSPNQVISGLFPGAYEVAKATGVKVVAIGSHREGDKVYVKVSDAFDMAGMEREEGMELLKERLATLKWELVEEYSKCRRSELPYGKDADVYWQKHVEALIAEAQFYDYELEAQSKYVEKGVCSPREAFAFLERLEWKRENAFLARGNIAEFYDK